MFARSSSRSFVCLRCQHRLAKGNNLHQGHITTHGPSRWASTSALPADEWQDGEYVDRDGEEINPQTSRRTNNATRRWQPAPTADLGVKVLGKPAEILVLPQERRKRRRRKPDHEQTDDAETTAEPAQGKSQLSIREVLAQESKPLSPSEIISTIDKLQQEYHLDEQGYDRQVWYKCRDTLTAGFTKSQLHRYIQHKIKESKTGISGRVPSPEQSLSRGDLATFILQSLWHHRNPALDATRLEKAVQFSPEHYRVLILSGILARCRTRAPDAIITRVPDHSGFEIVGPSGDVKTALSIIEDTESKIFTKVINLPEPLKASPDDISPNSIASDGAFISPRLARLVAKRNVAVKVMGDNKLQIFALLQRESESLERDILSANKESRQQASTQPISDLSLDMSKSVPLYWALPQSFSKQRSTPPLWHRCISPNLSSTTPDMSQQGSLKTVTEKLHRAVRKRPDHPAERTFQHYAVGGHVENDYTFDLGQSVFHQTASDIPDSASLTSTTTRHAFFQTQPSLLPQFLAAVEASRSPDLVSEELSGLANVSDRLIHMKLVPERAQAAPPLDLYALCPEGKDNATSLNMLEVSLSLTGAAKKWALPNMPVDLNLKRREKLILFRAGQPVDPRFAPLLAEISRQIVRTGQGDEDFADSWATLINLDLTSIGGWQQYSTQGEVGKTEPSRSKRVVEKYAIDREYIHRQFYDVSHMQDQGQTNPLYLEYLGISRREKLWIPSRETWRLVQTPLLHNRLNLPTTAQLSQSQGKVDGQGQGHANARDVSQNSNQVDDTTTGAVAPEETFNTFVKGSYTFLTALSDFIKADNSRTAQLDSSEID